MTLAEGQLSDFLSSVRLDSDPVRVRNALLAFFPELVNEFGDVSALLAADFYDSVRDVAPTAASFRAAYAAPVDRAQAEGSVRWAVGALFREDVSGFVAAITGAIQRLVLQRGRDTVTESARRDPVHTAYARIPSGADTCRFCIMLASRGAVYSDDVAAGVMNDFHDNCVVPGTFVSGPDTHTGYRRHYEGEIITLVTALGNKLTITPQHPILTDRGWVPAGLLNIGDELISAVSRDRNIVSGPNEYHVPSRIEDVVCSLGMMSSARFISVPGASEQFHGDGFTSEVDIVTRDNLLRSPVNSVLSEPFSYEGFHGTSAPISRKRFSSARLHEFHTRFRSLLRASGGDIRRRSLRFPLCESHAGGSNYPSFARAAQGYAVFREPSRYYISADAIALRERQDRVSARITRSHITGRADPSRRRVRVDRKFNPSLLYGDSEALRVFTELGADLRERLSSSVECDRLVDKRIGQHRGDVLNLGTTEGWYIANGITVSNCDCVITPIRRESDFPEGYDLRKFVDLYTSGKGIGRYASEE